MTSMIYLALLAVLLVLYQHYLLISGEALRETWLQFMSQTLPKELLTMLVLHV